MSANMREAFRSLLAHRLRSALAMLGVMIGVAAVVVMIAVGMGARETVAAQIRSLGSNLVIVFQGSARMNSVRLGAGAGHRLGETDASAIETEVPGVVAAAPVLHSREQLIVGSSNWQGTLRGVTPEYFTAREWRVASGRQMDPEDYSQTAAVVLLGSTMSEKLFGDDDPVNVTIRIRDVPFTVIGVLERKGQSVWGEDQDDVALVPLSAIRRHLVGVSPANPTMVHSITVKFAEWASADAIMGSIDDLLKQRHRLVEGQEDTFIVSNLAETAAAETSATRIVTVLLAIVASISLVVGGIGIMNVMLVTVTERTREIGLRRAVGARKRDILSQFLVEALALALAGGALGAAVGITLAITVGAFAQWPVIIDFASVLLALGFSALVGVIFGHFPARRAALLQPIEALRAE